MARIRSLNPCAPMDDDVAAMSIHARFVWAYLPCHADREGRLKDAPFMIKAAILPGDDVDMNAILDELAARRHIVRYQVDGRRFIQIRSFAKHQKPHTREVESIIPPPCDKAVPEHDLGSERAVPGLASMSPSPSSPDPDPDPSPDPDRGEGPRPADLAPNQPLPDFNAPRTSHGLLVLFGKLWVDAKGREWYGRPRAARAATEFMDRPPAELDKLAPLIRPAIEHYLANTKPFYLSVDHRFDVFVQDFDTLVAGSAPPIAPSVKRVWMEPPPKGEPRPRPAAAAPAIATGS